MKNRNFFLVVLISIIVEIEINSASANPVHLQEESLESTPFRSIRKQFFDRRRKSLNELRHLVSPYYASNENKENSDDLRIQRMLETDFFTEDPNDNSVDALTTDYSPPSDEDSYKPLYDNEIKNIESSNHLESLKAASSTPSNGASKPPSMPELPFGLPNSYSNSQGSQTPTLILGGFSIVVMPMPGMTPGNMANLFQPGQQLGQASGTNPFMSTVPVSG